MVVNPIMNVPPRFVLLGGSSNQPTAERPQKNRLIGRFFYVRRQRN